MPISNLPRLGAPEDPDSCIVITAQAKKPATAVTPPLETYNSVVLPLATWYPLGPSFCLSVPYLIEVAKAKSGVYNHGGGARHAFSHVTYNYPVCDERPAGIAYTPLLVGGPRQWQRSPDAHGAPPQGCWQDAFVAWMPRRGQPEFPTTAVLMTDYGVPLIETRKAIGSIVTTYPVHDGQTVIAYETFLLLIEVGFFLRPPDHLKLDLYGHRYRHPEPTTDVVTLSDGLTYESPSWTNALAAAVEGFNHECSVAPIAFVIPQIDATERNEFDARIRRFDDWRKALDEVNEAWQLEIVCRAYADHPDFSHRPTLYKRAKLMLEIYLQERVAESQRLDDLWPQITQNLLAMPA